MKHEVQKGSGISLTLVRTLQNCEPVSAFFFYARPLCTPVWVVILSPHKNVHPLSWPCSKGSNQPLVHPWVFHRLDGPVSYGCILEFCRSQRPPEISFKHTQGLRVGTGWEPCALIKQRLRSQQLHRRSPTRMFINVCWFQLKLQPQAKSFLSKVTNRKEREKEGCWRGDLHREASGPRKIWGKDGKDRNLSQREFYSCFHRGSSHHTDQARSQENPKLILLSFTQKCRMSTRLPWTHQCADSHSSFPTSLPVQNPQNMCAFPCVASPEGQHLTRMLSDPVSKCLRDEFTEPLVLLLKSDSNALRMPFSWLLLLLFGPRSS